MNLLKLILISNQFWSEYITEISPRQVNLWSIQRKIVRSTRLTPRLSWLFFFVLITCSPVSGKFLIILSYRRIIFYKTPHTWIQLAHNAEMPVIVNAVGVSPNRYNSITGFSWQFPFLAFIFSSYSKEKKWETYNRDFNQPRCVLQTGHSGGLYLHK